MQQNDLLDHLAGVGELQMLIACAAIWLTPITRNSAGFSPLTMVSINSRPSSPIDTLQMTFASMPTSVDSWLFVINNALESAAEKPQLSKIGAA
jgi:hypothetical protein